MTALHELLQLNHNNISLQKGALAPFLLFTVSFVLNPTTLPLDFDRNNPHTLYLLTHIAFI